MCAQRHKHSATLLVKVKAEYHKPRCKSRKKCKKTKKLKKLEHRDNKEILQDMRFLAINPGK